MRTGIVVCLLLALSLGDEKESVEAAAKRAVALYQSGKTQEAGRIFQALAARCLEEGAGSIAGFVVAAPKDVKRTEPKVSTGTFGSGQHTHRWSQVVATFTWPDGTVVRLTISTNDQMVQAQEAMTKMFKNPQYRQMMQNNPNVSVDVEEKGAWLFLTQVQKQRANASFTATTKGGVVSATVNRSDADKFKFIRDGTDWDGLAGAMSR